MKNTKSIICRREVLLNLLWLGSGSLLPGMLSEARKTPLDTHLEGFKNSMMANNPNLSENILREYLTPRKIITRQISGVDYKFSFLNSAGHKITISLEQGRKKTVIG